MQARSAGTREIVHGLGEQKRVYELTESFVRRGYKDVRIQLILGKNWQRVLKQIWKS